MIIVNKNLEIIQEYKAETGSLENFYHLKIYIN